MSFNFRITWVAHVSGYWVYPFLRVMSFSARIAFFVFAGFVMAFFYFLGKWKTKFIFGGRWNNFIVQFLYILFIILMMTTKGEASSYHCIYIDCIIYQDDDAFSKNPQLHLLIWWGGKVKFCCINRLKRIKLSAWKENKSDILRGSSFARAKVLSSKCQLWDFF